MANPYAPQAGDFQLDDGEHEEFVTAIGIYNSISRDSDQINPRLARSLSKKQEKRVLAVLEAMRGCRKAVGDYIVAAVYELLEEASDLEGFRAAFVERAGTDPRETR